MFLTKSHEISAFGRYPGARTSSELMHSGMIILDKWQGPTSRDVASDAKKILSLDKVGYHGTLDPMVSGVLVLCLENACKIMPALESLEKEYVGVMRLHKDVSEKDIRKTVSAFTGKIRQKPPVRSAVARLERTREIYGLEIIEISGNDVLFKVRCEAGTYIRKLCHDIGLKIGGAHMSELRRTRAGRFTEDQACRMHDIAAAYAEWKDSGSEALRNFILPVEAGIEHLRKVIIKDSAVYSVANGSPLYDAGVSKAEKGITKGELVAVLTLRGELASIGHADMTSEEMMKRKGIAVRTDRVIIDKGYYPKPNYS